MPVDLKILQRKIALILRDLKNLKSISVLPFSKYVSKDEYEALTERYLERIIGRMIDINFHILTNADDELKMDYHESFVLMGEKKHLPMEFAREMASSAGLRNRLAHEYDEIDVSKVYAAIPKCLKDTPKYLKYIEKFCDNISKQKKLI